MRRFQPLWLGVFISLFASLAYSQANPPSADTMTYSTLPTKNYGSYISLFVQVGTVASNSYIQFNMSSLPTGAVVSKATLRLYVNQVGTAGSFDVYELDSSWSESTLNYNNAPPLGSSATGGNPIAFTTSTLNQFVLVDITPLVQNWVEGSIANHGIALSLTTSAGAIAFDSKEATLTSHQPELEIALAGSGSSGVTSWNGRTGAVVPQSGDYSFSLLSGTLMDGQLSGTYGGAITLSSASNIIDGIISGNGAGLTNVPVSAGSPYYIQNGTTQQTGASFNIDGSGSVGTNYQIGGVPVLSLNTTNSTLMLGPSAGNSVATFSTFLGMNSGMNETAGQNTVAVGYNSGASLNGSDNTLVGTNSGYQLGTGGGPASSQNTFVGSGAGLAFAFGTGNILLGYQAGWQSSGGNYNIFIGDGSGNYSLNHPSSDIYISNSETGSDNNTIRIGTQGTGNGQQNQVFIAGIVGTTISNGSTVFVDSNGRLGVGASGSGGVTSFNGRTGAVVPANNDYSFSQLSGTLGDAQLTGNYGSALNFTNGTNQFSGSFSGSGSGLTNVTASGLAAGTYSNALTLSNAGNSFTGGSFTGNGSGLTNINATTFGGLLPSGFILNSSTQQASSNFNISGSGTAAGTLTATTAMNTTGTYQIGGSTVLNASADKLSVGLGAGSTSNGATNTFIGYDAGNVNTGAGNTYVGGNAGANSTTSNNDTFLGAGAGKADTASSNDTMLGNAAGAHNTTGGSLTIVGAGADLSGGNNNTIVGANAGASGSTGSSNTIMGAGTGTALTNGDTSTLIGNSVGTAITTGSRNTIVGFAAGQNLVAGYGNVYVASSGSADESNTIRIGMQGTGVGQQNQTYIAGITSQTISGGSAVFVNSNGMLGVGASGSSGVTSFNGRTGAVVPAANDYSFSLLSGTLGSSQLGGTYQNALVLSNINADIFAGISFTGGTFTGNGSGLTNVTASGLAAGTYANAVSFSNTGNSFTGNGAGLTNVPFPSGSTFYIQNGTAQQASSNFNISGNGTAAGTLTGTTAVNTPGAYEIGGSTILATPGSNNMFLGIMAGSDLSIGNNDVFLGYHAGAKNDAGSSNAFVGYSAGPLVTSGLNNTFVGANTGASATTGSNNLFLGEAAGANVTTGSNNIEIGVVGANDNATIRIGNNQTSAYLEGVYGVSLSNASTVVINTNGQLGTIVSSRRFKEDILDMGDASSKLFQLRPVTFFYKPQYDDGSHILQYGLIAEEVAKVYPDLVVYDKDGLPSTVKYQLLTPMLLNELQKQHKIVSDQQDVIQTQQQQIEDLQRRLSRLETLIPQQTSPVQHN